MITLVDVLNRHAAEQPEKIAVHFRDQSLTYAQLRRQAGPAGGLPPVSGGHGGRPDYAHRGLPA